MAWTELTRCQHDQKGDKYALKSLAVALGLLSTISTVQDWQLAAMMLGLPFCLIWTYCAWLRAEPQLKYINIVVTLLYVYGIARYFVINR